MQGDFTRWTFAPQQGYRSVLLQQGRVLLDADWNEQAEITAHHDEVRTRDVVGSSGGPADGVGFAVVDTGGKAPQATPWNDLRITPGRYYVEGVLVDAPAPAGLGWPLGDQPHVRTVAGVPSLTEPQDDGDYAVLLDVWTHHVTADEQPSLREPALGGPDTTTRAQTVWQVRLVRLREGESRRDLHTPGHFAVPRGTMTASLRDAAPDSDPCRITASGGYQRLENQLYRVQIHDTKQERPSFLWSRENGSVVAGLSAITSVVAGTTAELTLDREGRDEELSIREGDTVEVTSTDLQLRSQPGFLATAGAPHGLRLPVHWIGTAPASLTALGRAPLVRRWEGRARPVSEDQQDLEGGIQVRFPSGGTLSVGDYWLIPARTMRHVYGMTTMAGTIDWPAGAMGVAEPRPPVGPLHHIALLAILTRASVGWTLSSDCRRRFPSLTELVTLDLVGGDGQEALPGQPLPQPVRVAAHNGGLPVKGATVRFTTRGGVLQGGGHTGEEVPVATGPDGVATVTWALDSRGAPTQTLTAQLLDDSEAARGVAVTVSGRLSIAAQVAWTPAPSCEGFAPSPTVQSALDSLATRAELRLLGGDGQHLRQDEKVLPQPVRVIVDSPCGQVEGTKVIATASTNALVAKALADEAAPGNLPADSAQTAEAETDEHGTAAFWWQPVAGAPSDVLRVRLRDDSLRAAVTVTAQSLPAPATPTGPIEASEVTWRRPSSCNDMGNISTVQDALVRLATRRELRLLAGDGQQLSPPDKVLPQPVRVIVDSPCGPLAGQLITAQAAQGAVVKKKEPDETAAPSQLLGSNTGTAQSLTNGAAEFWWQPAPNTSTHTLTLTLQGDTRAPIVVTAQTARGSGTPGVHITKVAFNDGTEFKNDQDVSLEQLAKGINVTFDGDIKTASVSGKPVLHIYLDLPFPLGSSHWSFFDTNFIGWLPVEVSRTVTMTSRSITWNPPFQLKRWLTRDLPESTLSLMQSLTGETFLPGRLSIDGWAIVSATNPNQCVNCHAAPFLETVGSASFTRLRLPTDDGVTGGQYVQWFRLKK